MNNLLLDQNVLKNTFHRIMGNLFSIKQHVTYNKPDGVSSSFINQTVDDGLEELVACGKTLKRDSDTTRIVIDLAIADNNRTIEKLLIILNTIRQLGDSCKNIPVINDYMECSYVSEILADVAAKLCTLIATQQNNNAFLKGDNTI